MKVLLCDPDLAWSTQIAAQMKQHGITVKGVDELEELWNVSEEIQGILVSLREIESMLFWGKDVDEQFDIAGKYPSAIRSLCQQGKKVIVILSDLNYEAEYCCLQAGAVECIHKKQPVALIIQRILLALQIKTDQEILRFEGIRLHCLTGMVVYQDQSIHLTKMEQRVFAMLIEHGRELTEKQQLLLHLWGSEDIPNGRLETLIKQIRHKLQDFPVSICTDYGRGYYLGNPYDRTLAK